MGVGSMRCFRNSSSMYRFCRRGRESSVGGGWQRGSEVKVLATVFTMALVKSNIRTFNE